MKTYKELQEEIQSFVAESTNDRVYLVKNILWVSYAPGSGTTSVLKDTFRDFLTDKKNHENYDYIVNEIMKWAKETKPTKKGSKGILYKIPVYDSEKVANENGKESSFVWMVIISEQDYNIIQLFKTRNEANYWIN